MDSIADFISMYLDKGFRNNYFSLNDIRRIKAVKPDYNMSFKNKKITEFRFCQLREEEIGDQVIMVACCMTGRVNDGEFLIGSKANLFISKDFVYNPSRFDISEFIRPGGFEAAITYGRFRYDKFHKRYPELKLKEYIESGGMKYLDFLLSSNNNRLLELVGKSGLGYLANQLSRLKCINHNGKNVKEVFGVPIKTL